MGGCDATMEAQNNNQPTLDNQNNLYKIPGQEDQVGRLSTVLIDRFKVPLIKNMSNDVLKHVVSYFP